MNLEEPNWYPCWLAILPHHGNLILDSTFVHQPCKQGRVYQGECGNAVGEMGIASQDMYKTCTRSKATSVYPVSVDTKSFFDAVKKRFQEGLVID